MRSLDVYCTDCLARKGEPCTTIRGESCNPHQVRVRLAATPGPCDQCHATFGEPCYCESGETRMYPHQTRATA